MVPIAIDVRHIGKPPLFAAQLAAQVTPAACGMTTCPEPESPAGDAAAQAAPAAACCIIQRRSNLAAAGLTAPRVTVPPAVTAALKFSSTLAGVCSAASAAKLPFRSAAVSVSPSTQVLSVAAAQ